MTGIALVGAGKWGGNWLRTLAGLADEASAIRRADPEVKIAGPAEWGWLALHYSAKDVEASVLLRPDRRQHGDEPLVPWYLKKIREQEQRTGTRLLDILDVHFYPAGEGIGHGTAGRTDPDTAARRIRSTRGLWDPSYVDESFIKEKMRLLPLLREWIAAYHPGLELSIGEWNFGAETHMSGGLATAKVHWGNLPQIERIQFLDSAISGRPPTPNPT